MYSFGPGSLFGIPAASGSTPRRFGGIQDSSFDFSFDVKELYGGYQFPLAIARGKGKITGKAKTAVIHGNLFNDIFFSQTTTSADITTVAVDEAGSVPATTTYTITTQNSATWTADLGVTYAATGLALEHVTAGSEATGKYSVAAGVYTFDATDASAAVKINYEYTLATGGTQIAISNQLLGTTPLFKAVFTTVFEGKTATWVFNRVTSSKLTLATKLEDFQIPEFDMAIFADDSGNIGTMTFTD